MRRKSDGGSILVTEKRDCKNKGKATAECYHCGEKGHITKYCRQLKFNV